jgi:hypothetical protein
MYVCGCVCMFLFHVADIRLRAAFQMFVRILLISVLIIHLLHSLSYDRSIASFKASFSQNHFILSFVFSAINCF